MGLSREELASLVSNTTHIVYNAWPMSGTRKFRAFEPHFALLKELINFAVAAYHQHGTRITSQFISSIGVAGYDLVDVTHLEVAEVSVPITSVPPVGYCEAKWTCERILDKTLHQHQQRFRTMVVRPGQISGSSSNGYWNPIEHFVFLVKSSQTLRVFPALQGRLQWAPVDAVANTIVDLAMREGDAYPIYHVDNPVCQPWEEMVSLLVKELRIPKENVIPFSEWVRRVKRSPLREETENPALRVIDFLEKNFVRMSCGELILGTSRSKEHSSTLAELGPVSAEVARRYIRAWKEAGFLSR